MESLEERVSRIEQRNKSVELDKAWEVSISRRIILFGFTYVVVALFFVQVHIEHPWTTALEPALAFLVSTLTMPYLRTLWVRWNGHE